jgi:predicted GTPase
MIRMPDLRHVRGYWRELMYVLAIVLPWLTLLPLGVLWLSEHSLLLWWFVATAMVGALAFGQRLAITRNARAEAATMAAAATPASPEWGTREREAWRLVEAACDDIAPFTFLDTEPIQAALFDVVDRVATHFRPNERDARMRLTLPEVLLLTERFARDARAATLRNVPGSRRLLISEALRFRNWAERWGPTASQSVTVLDGVRRILRGVVNPAGAAVQESTRALVGKAGSVLALRARVALTALILREAGRAAIDLYSGRLRLSALELTSAEALDRSPATDLVGPVRILLAGQVNAGKSSLFNALAGKVHRHVGVLPSPEGSAELTLTVEGELAVILTDTTGLAADPSADAELLAGAARADLIVWVASATQPAREPDVRALDSLRAAFARTPERRAPPILCALTHVDELSPKAEWAPPYDLRESSRPKARRIREAVEHVAATLAIPVDRMAPISVKANAEPYGVTMLWAEIGAQLDEARFAKLDRIVHAKQPGGLREVMRQAWNAGRALSSLAWSGRPRDGGAAVPGEVPREVR